MACPARADLALVAVGVRAQGTAQKELDCDTQEQQLQQRLGDAHGCEGKEGYGNSSRPVRQSRHCVSLFFLLFSFFRFFSLQLNAPILFRLLSPADRVRTQRV